jgi:phosphate starvation-inducible PhoH-like protein
LDNDVKEIIRIEIHKDQDTNSLFGNLDENLKKIEEAFHVNIVQRQDELVIEGINSKQAENVIKDLLLILESEGVLDAQKVNYVINLQEQGLSYRDSNVNKDIVCFTHRGKPIKAKTLGQTSYIEEIRKKDIVFGVGPAGTGKTYLAVAMAATAFKNKEVEKIILARPAVEAGERLGFLPGDLQEKVDPYLRPLYDALYDILGRDATLRLKEKETIEVVPLAYMRGRTVERSFSILDEAQNTTQEQMKMFLTRMGFGSKVVITGDITQIDLDGKASGLIHATKILKNVKEIGICRLKDSDVVRHSLVKKIINAYDRVDKNK